ncbi:hypothetical protein TMatcc_007885 [Talaromyces marneffei ATCC 18224]|uniref:uncharacterized protein n=1 Tax=Talaromyces marneffei TaxID=37727 RepID=UPI0012A82A2B|nr:uncharacterized protein EYB26_004800 [Talaromyces marneffei]KAE8552734.1 hypothetical protein EYB25_004113 [Talaromyces marneffei]QGA17130.1 hypothetical protein EYB26_004800 [Talaromyces marneffei]
MDLHRSLSLGTIRTSGTKPDLSKFATLRFILNAEDSNGVKHITGDRGYFEKEPLEIKSPGNFKLWLTIDNKNPPPFECRQINDFKVTGDCNCDLYTRVFDTEKEAFLRSFFKPGDDRDNGTMRSALTKDEFHFGDWTLEPGKYVFRVIGPINFTYENDEKEPQGFEEVQVDLSFWFELEANSKPSSPRENPVTPSDLAYFTEEQLKQMRKSSRIY